ncbi:hypothetical protein SLEP1_g59863 [Rubroshorea leprosula]|uniref:Uncharacterized protein n=1 Tax=Rubroshorea leprosula TaxID=152421 RepID=A0AAV5MUX6_9ROSI|nr:hypothetical protein SLEP1_g59863 [Rubroshorea leprosula]
MVEITVEITVTDTDIEKGTLTIPEDSLGTLRSGQRLKFTDEHTSQTWDFEYNKTGGCLRCKDWLASARGKEIRAGDRIDLSRNGKNIKVIPKK